MGLLDSLGYGNQGGYGGLLDALLYPSPLMKPPEVQQPQYDAMGNYTGITPDAPNPFGPLPQMSMPKPGSFQPPSSFNGGAAPLPGMAPGVLQPAQPQQPQSAPTQPPAGQVNDANVGGYQMPRIGSVADYTPQAAPTDVSAQSRSPQLAQPQIIPPALGSNPSAGLGDRLMAGVQNFANAGGPLQALAGGLSGLVSGNRTDAAGVAQQNLKAQYESLVPMLGPQKAMLAVMNPEAGKILLAQALEKKQYGFTKLDNDTLVRTDPMTGKAEIAYGGERSNTIQGPDGKLITMPEGADPKTWRNEITRINADVAAGKKTEVQAKAEIFANKMEQSNKSISDSIGTSLSGKIASGLPLGNYVQTPEYQKYKQASSNFITALLRQESGAAISKTEFDRYEREYMPQPGDGKEVLAQKAEARRVAIDGMKKGAGPGYKSPTQDQPSGVRKYNPVTGRIE
jgi:hypothetical protein